MYRHRIVLLLCLVVGVSARAAELKLPALFCDGMVLQCDQPARVWGWAAAGQTVVVSFADQQVESRADEQGRWQVSLAPLSASRVGRALTVSSPDAPDRVVAQNVVVGEVWLCAGQSNMHWPVELATGAAQEIAAADVPDMRLFHVEPVTAEQPRDDIGGQWSVCSPDSVKSFSAVGYVFGRELRDPLQVPVGLIQATWGDTPVEAWTSREKLLRLPDAAPLVAIIDEPTNEPQKAGARLFNGMIAPLTRYAIRGVIWYQGEGNASFYEEYRTLFPGLIEDWRAHWQQDDMPFLFVQLAAYKQPSDDIRDDTWPRLRDAQRFTHQTVEHTGMAVAIDLGDKDNPDNIHPPNKHEVGRRLSLLALKDVYHVPNLVASGPIYQASRIDRGRVLLRFDTGTSGLKTSDGQPPREFAIAGQDHLFVRAQARIVGNDTIEVWSDQVKAPVAVRYAWAMNPVGVNLVNRDGLPAEPFRTDDWPR